MPAVRSRGSRTTSPLQPPPANDRLHDIGNEAGAHVARRSLHLRFMNGAAARVSPMVRMGRSPRITPSLGVASRSKAGAPSRTRSSGRAGCATGNGKDRHAPSPRGSACRCRGAPGARGRGDGAFQRHPPSVEVCPETLQLLKNKGIPAHALQTEGAVPRYRARRTPVTFTYFSISMLQRGHC